MPVSQYDKGRYVPAAESTSEFDMEAGGAREDQFVREIALRLIAKAVQSGRNVRESQQLLRVLSAVRRAKDIPEAPISVDDIQLLSASEYEALSKKIMASLSKMDTGDLAEVARQITPLIEQQPATQFSVGGKRMNHAAAARRIAAWQEREANRIVKRMFGRNK